MKLLFFDLDGTLIEEDSSWGKLHNHFGADPGMVKRNLEDFCGGRFDYREWMRRDIALWMHARPTFDEIKKVLLSHTLSRNVKEALSCCLDCKFFIVSSGIDVLAQDVGKALGFTGYFANGLEARDGFLTGEGIYRVNPLRKYEIVDQVRESLGVRRDDAIAIGDSFFDLSLFHGCAHAIAYRPQDERVAGASDFLMEDFSELPGIISSLP